MVSPVGDPTDADESNFNKRIERMTQFTDYHDWELNKYHNTKLASLLLFPLNEKIKEILENRVE